VQAWNAGSGVRYLAGRPPERFAERLRDPEWMPAAVKAIALLPQCKFFSSPVPLNQFLRYGFVEAVLSGQYANPRAARVSATVQKLGLHDAAPPRKFSGDDAARFEATRQRELQKLKEACE
jgi:hypothetical protein